MKAKNARKPVGAKAGTRKAAPTPKAKGELSDQEMDGISGGVVKFKAGKALKDAVK